MRKLYKLCPKDEVCQISEYFEWQFMRRCSKISPDFTPFCPNRFQPLDFHKLEFPFP